MSLSSWTVFVRDAGLEKGIGAPPANLLDARRPEASTTLITPRTTGHGFRFLYVSDGSGRRRRRDRGRDPGQHLQGAEGLRDLLVQLGREQPGHDPVRRH